MKNSLKRKSRGNKFLSGFANENIIEDVYVGNDQHLSPSTIVSENKDQYKIEIGIPFLKKSDIHIEIDKDQLHIYGKQQMKVDDQKARVYKGVFQIAPDVLVKDIDYSFENHLLKIILPKKRIAKHLEKSGIEEES